MRRLFPTAVALVGFAVLASACSDSPVADGAPATSSSDPVVVVDNDSTTAPETPIETTTTVPVIDRLPDLADSVDGAIRSSDGSALAITGTDGEVWFVVGACQVETVEPAASAESIGAQHVVLDPGSSERDDLSALNLAVAEGAAEILREQGVAVTLTREQAQPISETARGSLAPAVGAYAVVSIHHFEGLEPASSVRPTVFHEIDDLESRRLAGLLHEEITDSLSEIGVGLATVAEPGVRPLLNQRGQDYFVVLQASAEAPAVRMEITALAENDSSPLVNEEARVHESQAIADAVVRFLVSNEEGYGFVESAEVVRPAPTSNNPGDCG